MKTENRPRVSSQDEDVISGFPQDSTSRLTFLSCFLLPVFGSLTVCFIVFILSTLLFFCHFIVLYHYAKRLPVIAFIKLFALMLDSDEIIPKRDLILFLDAEMSIK